MITSMTIITLLTFLEQKVRISSLTIVSLLCCRIVILTMSHMCSKSPWDILHNIDPDNPRHHTTPPPRNSPDSWDTPATNYYSKLFQLSKSFSTSFYSCFFISFCYSFFIYFFTYALFFLFISFNVFLLQTTPVPTTIVS